MTSARSTGSRASEAASVATRARRSGAVARGDQVLDGARLRLAGTERTSRLRGGGAGVVLGASVIVAILFAVAVVGTILVGQQAHIDRTNGRISAAETRAEELRVQLAELQSPHYVTTRAATVLGMIPAPTPVYLQPRESDDARAAEVPPTTPPTTVRPAAPVTTPTTAARATTATTAPRSTPTTVKR